MLKILITTEPIWFFFTVKILIGQGISILPDKSPLEKKLSPIIKTILKMDWGGSISYPTLNTSSGYCIKPLMCKNLEHKRSKHHA